MERTPCPSCVANGLRGCGNCGGTGFASSRPVLGRRSYGDEAIAKAAADSERRDARNAARRRGDVESDALAKTVVEPRSATGGGTPYGLQDAPQLAPRMSVATALARRDAASAEIARMVEAVRVASNFALSEAQATSRVLKTTRGAELYREYDQASFDAVRAMDGY